MTNIYSQFISAVGLNDADRHHLVEHRCLSPEFIKGGFASGDLERVQPALNKLFADGFTEEQLRQAHLIDEHGRPQGYLVAGKILIGYFDENHEVIQVRAHQLGPKGVSLEIYGREFLADQPQHLVLCEGEFKAAALLSRGVAAIAVPGISSFIGDNYERLLKHLHDAGVKEVIVCFDNEDKVTPTLPSGTKNDRYKPDRSRRYDTQWCAIVMARRLTGDGFPTTIAWLPDDWRDASGKVDIDSAFRDEHTLEEVQQVLDQAVDPNTFLAGQTEEAQQVIRHRLCEGKPRVTEDGWKLRDGDIDIVVENGPAKRTLVVISSNYRRVFCDRIDIASAKSRSSFVAQVKKDNPELDITAVEHMLVVLSLAIEAGAQERVQGVDGDAVHIGSQTAVVRPEGIFLVQEGRERQVSNFNLVINEDQTINDGVEVTRLLRGEVHVDGGVIKVELPGTALGTPTDFAKAVFASTGTAVNFFGPGAEAVVKEVALASSQPTRTKCDQKLGWDEDGCYRTPGECFNGNGPVVLPGLEIGLKGQRVAEHLGMNWIDDDELRNLARHIHDDFLEQASHDVTFPLLGHIFSAPLFSWLKMGGRPAMMLRGPTERGPVI